MTEVSVRAIVDGLNAPPLSRNFTLVSFDQLAPAELVSLLNDVFYVLDPKTVPKDLKEETPEYTAYRMADFLRVLGYRHLLDSQQFQLALIQGDKNVIYPVLQWILPKIPDLQKRAYLARFLVNIEVPPEYFQDQIMTDTYNQYKELQEAFKETHKGLEALRKQQRNPADLKTRIAQLEDEKDQLTGKIANVQKRIESQPRFDALFAASSELRRETDELARLQQQITEQQQLLVAAQTAHREASRRLGDVKSTVLEGNAETLVGQLRSEVAALTEECETRLPQEIAAKEDRRSALRRILTETDAPDLEIQRLSDEINGINRQIAAIQERRAAAMQAASGEDSRLSIFRQQAGFVAQKKADTSSKLAAARTLLQKLETELAEKEKYLSSFRGSKQQVLKGAAFKEYATKLREKSAQCKQLKSELDRVLSDLGVAQRTEQVLRSRLQDLEGKTAALERQRGVAGYQQTQARLEEVSAKKSEVDEGKERTLTEISRIVQDINAQIKERKSRLAPLIKDLRALRERYQEVESDYLQKKGVYDSTAAGLDTERAKLEQEVNAYADDCRREEQRYHTLQLMLQSQETLIQRVAADDKIRLLPASQRGGQQPLRERYAARIAALEAQSKEWREKQKKIKETFKSSLEQVQHFTALKKLLQLKLGAVTAADGASNPRQPLDLADLARAGAPTYAPGQVDRLVL